MIARNSVDQPVILYGAGRYAKYAYEHILENGATPVCFADRDISKCGKAAFEGSMLIVYSLEEAMQLHSDADLYVSVDGFQKYSIFAYLVEEKGISPNTIMNYEPYIKRKSCALLETTIAPLGERDVGLCRGGRFINVTTMPTVKWTDNAPETLDSFLSMRQRLIDEIAEAPENSPCYGCAVLRDYVWPSQYRVIDYVLSTEPASACQFRCTYCYSGHYGNNELSTERSSDLKVDKRVNLLMELEQRGLASPAFTTICLSDGELCVDPKRDNLFSLAERYTTRIFTNAGIYSEKIASLLERKKTSIVVSVDAGTRETFKKIKNADAYDKMCDNLRRYAAIDNKRVCLQYIYLPGENDSDADIDGFVRLCSQLKVETVNILIDVLSDRADLGYKIIYKLFKFVDKLLINGFDIFLGGNVSLSKNERDMLWRVANEEKDGTIRNEQYYEQLKYILSQTVY